VAAAGEQRRQARSEVTGVHALDAKDTNIPLFEACDEVCDSSLAKVHGGQVKHHRLADEKPGRAGECRVNLFKPAYDRNDWAKDKRHVRSASHANQLTCWLRNCVHGGRLDFLFEWLKMGGLG
jgi:hypothetical protein